jgi:hypothetical protein
MMSTLAHSAPTDQKNVTFKLDTMDVFFWDMNGKAQKERRAVMAERSDRPANLSNSQHTWRAFLFVSNSSDFGIYSRGYRRGDIRSLTSLEKGNQLRPRNQSDSVALQNDSSGGKTIRLA